MRDYFKIISVAESEVNKFLANGWEIIETVKSREEYGEYVKYHIGFSLKKAFETSLEILHAYEKHNLRIQLLEAEANEIGEDLADYQTYPGAKVENSLSELLEKTDFILTGTVNTKYYKKRKDEVDFSGIEF